MPQKLVIVTGNMMTNHGNGARLEKPIESSLLNVETQGKFKLTGTFEIFVFVGCSVLPHNLW